MPRLYRSFIAHLHSAFEGPAGMAGFCHEAARHGIDIAWFSDHDTRVVNCALPPEIPPRLNILKDPSLSTETYSWQVIEEPAETAPAKFSVAGKASGNRLSLSSGNGNWQGITLAFRGRGNRWQRPLFCRPVLSIGLETGIKPTEGDRRLVVELETSQLPPGHRPKLIKYCLGNPDGLGESFPLRLEKGGVNLDLAAETARAGTGSEALVRQVRIRLEARRGKTVSLDLGAFSLQSRTLDPDALLACQARLAAETGKRFGVETLVSFEVSGTGVHMNCYGHLPPVIASPGPEGGSRPSPADVARYLAAGGYVLSLNHPFSSYKKEEMSPRRRCAVIRLRSGEIIDSQAHGAHLIEVGYPEGRHGFSADEYLSLWDRVNLSGLRLPGIGVSDAHSNSGWDRGNNFANYAAADDDRPESLVASLGRGRFYMADPARFRGRLELVTDRGKTMGDEQSGGSVTLNLEGVPPGASLAWVVDGRTGREKVVSASVEARKSLAGMKKFVRAQVRDARGRLIILTNPIWSETAAR